MDCPKCKTQLEPIKRADVKLFQCKTCHGHLVEKRRVSKMERRINKDVASLSDEIANESSDDTTEHLRCPRCRDRMAKREKQKRIGFMIDECKNCDFVWLDGGEVAKIQVAYESRAQTQELNRMRTRLASMTAGERREYEQRIANLTENTGELELMSAVSEEISLQFYLNGRHHRH